MADQPNNAATSILVIEDNPVALAAVSLFLRECGYEVVQTMDGDQAFKLLKGGLKPALVLSDISLPGSDGYRILKYVRSTLPTDSSDFDERKLHSGMSCAGLSVVLTHTFSSR